MVSWVTGPPGDIIRVDQSHGLEPFLGAQVDEPFQEGLRRGSHTEDELSSLAIDGIGTAGGSDQRHLVLLGHVGHGVGDLRAVRTEHQVYLVLTGLSRPDPGWQRRPATCVPPPTSSGPIPRLLDDIVFHAQAAEKTLKGFLVWHDRPSRKTHDLVELGHACTELDGALEGLLRRVAPLTEYAWRFRYPGDPEEPAADEALISPRCRASMLRRSGDFSLT